MDDLVRPWALVVDDEPELRSLVDFALTSQGFTVECAASAAEAWLMLQQRPYDIVILDVVMPGVSGVALCQRIRDELETPVILLTALSDPQHRVLGLEAGADDYVAKPFHPRELALRAMALYRRTHRVVSQEIVNGPLVVDPAARRVTYHSEEVRLSESEFRLCHALASHAGRPVTHAELIVSVWDHEEAPGGREMVKTAVWRLRWRLAQVHPMTLIESVRGVGYTMLRVPEGTTASP